MRFTQNQSSFKSAKTCGSTRNQLSFGSAKAFGLARNHSSCVVVSSIAVGAMAFLFGLIYGLICPVIQPDATLADTSSTVTTSIDDIISISAPTSASITLTPSADGSVFSTTDIAVSVSINAQYGYQLTMGTGGSTTDLVSDNSVIPSITSTISDVTADSYGDFTDNYWGFTTDNNAASDTTFGEINVDTYLPLATSNNPTLIKGTTTTASGDQTTVTVAAKINQSQAAGTYTNTLVFTAVANLYDVSGACFTTSENSDGTLSITSYDETCGTDVVIPATIMGKTVTAIAGGEGWNGSNDAYSQNLGAFANRGITSVSLPDTLTTIGSFAFYRNSLTTVDIPDSVTHVGAESFKNNQISTLKLGSGLKTISALAFSTNQLTTIDLPDSLTYLGTGAFTKNSVTGDAAFIYGINSDGSTDYTTLNSYAWDFKLLSDTTLTIPDVETIVSYAFRDMYNSSIDIILPDTIQSIQDYAFSWCSFNSLTIPSSIQSIPSTAFGTTTGSTSTITTVNIDRSTDAISGSPWGGNITTINWTGTE